MSAALRTAALAVFFSTVQFFTSLQALSPTPQFGFVFLSRTGALVLAATIVIAGAACAYALRCDAGDALRSPFASIAAAWIGATVLSSLIGFAPADGLQVSAMMLLCAAFGIALVHFYARANVARTVLGTYLVVGCAASLAGIVMVVLREPRPLYATSFGRAAGLFVTSNQFAEFADLFAFVALGIACGAASARLRTLGWAGAVLGFIALALTFSREYWLGAACAAIFFAFATGKRRAGALLAFAATAGTLAIALRTVPHHDPADAFSRLRTLDAGLRVATLFPLTGVGPVAYWRVYPAIAPVDAAAPGTFGALHPHDAYVSLAGELGLVGVVAAVWGWVHFGRAVARSLAERPQRERLVSLGTCAALVAILVSGIFDTIGVVQMTFVWLPFCALAFAAAQTRNPA